MASAPTSRGASHAWNHLTISTLERSKAMVTATIRISPNTICCANTLMPTKVMPTRATDTSKAPTRVRAMPPEPPVSAVPPTITAAMTGSRKWSASVGEPLPRRPAITTPASPAKNDEVANTRHLVTGTRRPDAIAAGSPAPMASVCRPKTVERCRNRQNANTAMPSKISCGTPNEVPVVQPSDALRISWPTPRGRVRESVSAAADAIPPIASVAMKEGMRSAVWMMPLNRPTPNDAASATTAASAPWRGSSSATITLESDATACNDRSMLPINTTKVVPAAMMNKVELSASKPSCVDGAKKPGCAISISRYSATRAMKGAFPPSFALSEVFRSDMSTSDHVFYDFDLRGLVPDFAGQDRLHPAIAHHHHPVAEAEDFFERIAGQHHGNALCGQLADELIDLLFGADIEPACRMVEHQNPAAREAPFRQHHFLLIAARQVAAGGVGAWRLDMQAMNPFVGHRAFAGLVYHAAATDCAQTRQRQVLRHAHLRHQSFHLALARHIPDAQRDGMMCLRPKTGRPHADLAGVESFESRDHPAQLFAARPDHPRHTEHLPPASSLSIPPTPRHTSSRPDPTPPATPNTSPPCTSNDTSLNAWPSQAWRTDRATSLRQGFCRLSRYYSPCWERPTINSRSCAAEASATGMSATTLPSFITYTRSLSDNSSSSRCDTNTKDARDLSSATSRNRIFISAASSMEVGSSSKMIGVPWLASESARASSTIWRWPNDRSSHRVSGSMSRCTVASSLRAARSSLLQFKRPRATKSFSRPRNRFSATVRVGRIDCSW